MSTEGPKRKIGLNLQNAPRPEIIKRETFEQKANDQFDKVQEYKNQIWDLSLKFKSLIESKVLPENKGPVATSFEKEVLDKLIQLAITMNNDELQEEGSGSAAINMLLMKCMLLQRDMINALSYKVDKLSADKK